MYPKLPQSATLGIPVQASGKRTTWKKQMNFQKYIILQGYCIALAIAIAISLQSRFAITV